MIADSYAPQVSDGLQTSFRDFKGAAALGSGLNRVGGSGASGPDGGSRVRGRAAPTGVAGSGRAARTGLRVRGRAARTGLRVRGRAAQRFAGSGERPAPRAASAEAAAARRMSPDAAIRSTR